eukprot:232233-Rhodomonas_salina.1
MERMVLAHPVLTQRMVLARPSTEAAYGARTPGTAAAYGASTPHVWCYHAPVLTQRMVLRGPVLIWILVLTQHMALPHPSTDAANGLTRPGRYWRSV